MYIEAYARKNNDSGLETESKSVGSSTFITEIISDLPGISIELTSRIVDIYEEIKENLNIGNDEGFIQSYSELVLALFIADKVGFKWVSFVKSTRIGVRIAI